LDGGILLIAGHLNRPLQHLVYLIEVEVAEQRRDYSPNAKGNFEFSRKVSFTRRKENA
jgi:hypothetical protein